MSVASYQEKLVALHEFVETVSPHPREDLELIKKAEQELASNNVPENAVFLHAFKMVEDGIVKNQWPSMETVSESTNDENEDLK